jgi:hypothetical protein
MISLSKSLDAVENTNVILLAKVLHIFSNHHIEALEPICQNLLVWQGICSLSNSHENRTPSLSRN